MEILTGVAATLIAALIFYFFTAFRTVNLSGEWQTIIQLTQTSYIPFKDLKIVFKFHLLHNNFEISGSGEKIKEIRITGEVYVFESDKRVLSEIEGSFRKNYFGKHKVDLHIIEAGRKRETRSTYKLIVKNHNKMVGTFIGTAATSSGPVEMKKS